MKKNFTLVAVITGTIVIVAIGTLHWYNIPKGNPPECVDAGNCLPSYSNNRICEGLPIGTPEHELLYRLGQPIARNDSRLYFESGEGAHGPIMVELDASRKATRLVCGSN